MDASYNYTAPVYVPAYVPPDYVNSATGANASNSKSKGGAPSVGRLGEVPWALMSAAWAVACWVWL